MDLISRVTRIIHDEVAPYTAGDHNIELVCRDAAKAVVAEILKEAAESADP